MSEQQAVVDQPDEQVMPESEGVDAQDLDSILSEWEETGEPEKQEPESDPKTTLKELQSLSKQLKAQHESETRKAAQKDFQETIKSIKGDNDWPDILVKGFLQEKALESPKLKNAYMNRHQNPDAWGKAQKALSKELEGYFGKKDSTKDEIASAVRNAKSTTPEVNTEKLGSLNNQDFESEKERIFSSLDGKVTRL